MRKDRRKNDQPKTDEPRRRVMFHGTIPFLVIVCFYCGTHLTLRADLGLTSTVITAPVRDFYNIRIQSETVYCMWCETSIGRTHREPNVIAIVRRYRRLRIDPVTIITSCRRGPHSLASNTHTHTTILATMESEPSQELPRTNLMSQVQMTGIPFRTRCDQVIKFFGLPPTQSSSRLEIESNVPTAPVASIELSDSSSENEPPTKKKALESTNKVVEAATKNSPKNQLSKQNQINDAALANFLDSQPSTSHDVFDADVQNIIAEMHTPSAATSTQQTLDENTQNSLVRTSDRLENITIDDPVEFFRAFCTEPGEIFDPELCIHNVAQALQERGISMNAVEVPLESINEQNSNSANNLPTNESTKVNQIVTVLNDSTQAKQTENVPEIELISSSSNTTADSNPTHTLGSIINDVVDRNYNSRDPIMPNILSLPVVTTSISTSASTSGSSQSIVTTTSVPKRSEPLSTATNSQISSTCGNLPDPSPSNTNNPNQNNSNSQITVAPNRSNENTNMALQSYNSASQNYNAISQNVWPSSGIVSQHEFFDSAPNYSQYNVNSQNYPPVYDGNSHPNICSNYPQYGVNPQYYPQTHSNFNQFNFRSEPPPYYGTHQILTNPQHFGPTINVNTAYNHYNSASNCYHGNSHMNSQNSWSTININRNNSITSVPNYSHYGGVSQIPVTVSGNANQPDFTSHPPPYSVSLQNFVPTTGTDTSNEQNNSSSDFSSCSESSRN